MQEWTPEETNTHQDHVIAHVLGTTALGYFHADEALHVALDIGFIWSIYLDGEMGLLPESVTISELDVDAEERESIANDIGLLVKEGRTAQGLRRVKAAPVDCLIEAVEFFARETGRRLLIRGEEAGLLLETSLSTREISVEALAGGG